MGKHHQFCSPSCPKCQQLYPQQAPIKPAAGGVLGKAKLSAAMMELSVNTSALQEAINKALVAIDKIQPFWQNISWGDFKACGAKSDADALQWQWAYHQEIKYSTVVMGQSAAVGGEVFKQLKEALPALRTYVASCPGCNDRFVLGKLIMHLNDSHRWDRTAIADYLDGLPISLAFPVPT